jgi:hypothetical protein
VWQALPFDCRHNNREARRHALLESRRPTGRQQFLVPEITHCRAVTLVDRTPRAASIQRLTSGEPLPDTAGGAAFAAGPIGVVRLLLADFVS